MLFASRAYVEANRDLLVAYFAGLLAGVEANVADPKAVIPLLDDDYGKDAEIDPAYSRPATRPTSRCSTATTPRPTGG